jgi:hypothetical protein
MMMPEVEPKLMNNSIIALILILMVANLLNCRTSHSPASASYGAITKYEKGKAIKFVDFTLEFIGERRVTTPQYARGFLYFDFNINTDSEAKIVSWTSGTGDIGPTEFELSGKKYLLERARSDKLGRLEENELVIWEK